MGIRKFFDSRERPGEKLTVDQNLTFPVQPDPISGMQCWHQAVRVRRAAPGDRHGAVHVDTQKAHEEYRHWLERTRPARRVSPDGTRRPYWLLRPLKPAREAYRLSEQGEPEESAP
ncbi:MAG: hypothetical protein ACE5JI_21680 [Acidobacteriota bacterium]